MADVGADLKDVWATGDSYEQYVGRWSRLVAHEFLDWLKPSDGLRWTDVGCGTGALAATILTQSNPVSVVGIEPSEGFLEVAAKQIGDSRARFERGDARKLPLANTSVDAAVSALMLNFVDDPQKVVAEMRRVVVPGGTVALYLWDYAGAMEFMRYFWDAAVALNADAAALDEGNRFPICQEQPLADLFRSVGLEDVETRAIDVRTDFSDFDDFWSPFLGGQGPAPTYCMALSNSDRERLRQRLRDAVPASADGSIHLKARAWGVRGRVPK